MLCTIPTFKEILDKSTKRKTFEENVESIIKYYNIKKELPSTIGKYKSLALFLNNQKTNYINNKLSEERYNLLITILTFKKKLNRKIKQKK